MPHLLQEVEPLNILLETGGLILLEKDLGLTAGDTGSALFSSRLVSEDELKTSGAPQVSILSFGPGYDLE